MGDGDVRDPCTAQLLADLPLRHISDAQPRPRPRPQLPSLQFRLQSQNLLGGGAVYSFEKPILFFNITTAVNRGLTVCLAHGGRGGGVDRHLSNTRLEESLPGNTSLHSHANLYHRLGKWPLAGGTVAQ